MIDSEPSLRSKKDLLIKFVQTTTLQSDSVDEDFEEFYAQGKDKQV